MAADHDLWGSSAPFQLGASSQRFPSRAPGFLGLVLSAVSVANELESADLSVGPAIELENVSVHAAGHTILEEINLRIAPGDHVAIVGPSGAGKSSLLGLLLGWYRSAEGSLLVDGAALEGTHLAQLRKDTAWVDPAV